MKKKKKRKKIVMSPLQMKNLWDEYIQFCECIKSALLDAQTMRTLPRAKELQQEAIEKLEDTLAKTSKLKHRAVLLNNEDVANRLLSHEFTIRAVIAELRMWIFLKEDLPNKAWDQLINSQDYVRDAIRAHDVSVDSNAKNYQRLLLNYELVLFPPQAFQSIGARIKSSHCSICHSAYGECDHIKGRPYMGQLCAEVADDMEIREVSLVENPDDKRCRVYSFSDGSGMTRDKMTWRLTPTNTPE